MTGPNDQEFMGACRAEAEHGYARNYNFTRVIPKKHWVLKNKDSGKLLIREQAYDNFV